MKKTAHKAIQISNFPKINPKWYTRFTSLRVRASAFINNSSSFERITSQFKRGVVYLLKNPIWIVIILLFALLVKPTPPHIVHAQALGTPISVESIKPLPKVKLVSYKPVEALEPVWLNKLRPTGTYANTYAAGQCTAGVAGRLPVPSGWGNANQWYYSAILAGYKVSGVPAVGTVAQTMGDSYLGHVAVVEAVNSDGSFLIWEMNGQYGPFTTDERVTTTAEFPNFIYI